MNIIPPSFDGLRTNGIIELFSFDKLTSSGSAPADDERDNQTNPFDKPILSQAEGLRAERQNCWLRCA